MNPIRCLTVDDERLARQGMRLLLTAHPDFQIVAEAANLTEAVQGFHRHRPDVIFLDIQMPGGDGFQVLDALGTDLPFVVFVTAHDRHALRAFEVNALDYLLKPVEPERLALALQRLRKRLSPHAPPESTNTPLPQLRQEDRALLPLGNSGCFAPVADIVHVTAHGKHSAVQLADGRRVQVRRTMASWLDRLPAESFAALDRGCIVQYRRIRRADITSTGARLTFEPPVGELALGRAAGQRLRPLLADAARWPGLAVAFQ